MWVADQKKNIYKYLQLFFGIYFFSFFWYFFSFLVFFFIFGIFSTFQIQHDSLTGTTDPSALMWNNGSSSISSQPSGGFSYNVSPTRT